MSYRTYIEGIQIFGNNECYPEWLEFIKFQGIAIDEEHCYEGEIHDFMGALVAIEAIVMRLHKQKEAMIKECGGQIGNRKMYGMFDLTHIVDTMAIHNQVDEHDKRIYDYGVSLFDELRDVIDHSYAFMPYALFLACEDKLQSINAYTTEDHFYCYKLKDGETIHVRAS